MRTWDILAFGPSTAAWAPALWKPLGLALLALAAPARAWRYSACAGLILSAFYPLFAPEALYAPGQSGWNPPGIALPWAWMFLNAGFWAYLAWEWAGLERLRPETAPSGSRAQR